MKLRGKVVFITDADSASGRALATRLSEEGAHLILNSLSHRERTEDERENAQVGSTGIVVISIDLCSSLDVSDALDLAEKQLGGTVDVLIHNNDLLHPALVETCAEDVFLAILNANAKSAFVCTQAAGRRMAAKRSGKIVYVSSIHAEKPTGSSFAYSASKGAVKMLAKEAALELGRCGIGVNTIELGPVRGDDERFSSGFSFLYDDYERKMPHNLPDGYDDLAGLVAYLASDEVRAMNGADIRLDGGFLLHYMDHKKKQLNDAGR
ncbi:SDR family NAD(P)-dependent oxidoreductase [Paenibacillus sp. R14(2021)]|uniref:SDR family NAD(P)-dependent oxidoreductase n=1 Tax=Paenibacillus sp. R14(2021) TaxID=2859228 RepID=UPI001C616999|nr:SDR family oxidoreductase [Paenibacillus sp. R14(2021)]